MKMQDIDHEKSGLLKKSISGGKWLTIGYIAERLFGTVSFIILARLLLPADFGVMAIALMVPKLFQSVSEPGFASAAIQKEGDVNKYLDQIWTLRILKSALIALAVYLLGPWIAQFFHAQSALLAIRLGGLFIFVQNLSNVGEIFFYKNLDFKKVVTRNLTKQIAYVAAAVASAYVLRSYWALMIGTGALYLAEAVSTYVLHPYRPRLSFDFWRLKDLFPYGKWIFGQGVMDQAYGFAENAIVSHSTSVSDVGFYTKAKSLAGVVPGFITSVVSVISFPAYARLKDEPHKIRDGFLKSMDVASFFVIPAIIAIAAGGGKLILILLGAKWLPMVQALRLLLLYYSLNIMVDISYELFNGMGQPDKKIKIDIGKNILTLILLLVLTPILGIVGTAWSLLLGLLPSLMASVYYLRRYIGLRKRQILRTALIPLFVCGALLMPLIIFKSVILSLSASLFLVLLALCGMVYTVIVLLIGKRTGLGPYQTLEIIFRHTIAYRI